MLQKVEEKAQDPGLSNAPPKQELTESLQDTTAQNSQLAPLLVLGVLYQ